MFCFGQIACVAFLYYILLYLKEKNSPNGHSSYTGTS